MKISIITATYNSSKTIETALRSVHEQTYPHIEHIIVDGASTDETVVIVNAYQKENSGIVLHSAPDHGIYDALNTGIAMATGDVIGFVHSDDMLANSHTLEHIAQVFQTTGCDGVYGDLLYVSQQNPHSVIRNWVSCAFQPRLLQQGWMPPHPTLFLKKAVYENYGHFNINYRIAADYEFILRVFKQPDLQINYLPQTLVKMRVGGASNRSLKNMIQKTKEDYKAIRTHQLGGWRSIFVKNISKLKQFLK